MARTAWHGKALILSLVYAFSCSAFANNPYVNLTAGGGIHTDIGETQTLTLFNVPQPGITNTYVADHNNLHGFLFGAGLGYQFYIYRCMLRLDLAVQGSYIHYGTVTGTVHPLVNVAPDFDTLQYSFDAESYLIMFQPSFVLETGMNWNPYITAGIGEAWNKLSSYDEFPLTGSTAAPTLLPFRSRTINHHAYIVGVGVETKLTCHVRAQGGYQYVHAGRASLNPELGQETNESISAGQLNTHFLTVSLLIS